MLFTLIVLESLPLLLMLLLLLLLLKELMPPALESRLRVLFMLAADKLQTLVT
jgi:hypothetical protein